MSVEEKKQVFLRRARIRKQAIKNAEGKLYVYESVHMTQSECNEMRLELFSKAVSVDQYACNRLFEPIVVRKKPKFIFVFLKKTLRKIMYKLLGWYYIPILNGQIEYNEQLKDIIMDMQKMIDFQQNEIEELRQEMHKTWETNV